MAEHTGIGWTDATWNPWLGCSKVSPGCAHCYMFREQERYGQDPTTVRRSKTKFAEPLRWKEPRMIFTCSWSDWFHEGADAWRPEAWAIIRRCPQHTFQILTKRPERIAAHLPDDWGAGYPNVWLGVSVENQRMAHRAATLTAIPAVVRFISAEPLLGPLNLTVVRSADDSHWRRPLEDGIHWVIVGGESGPECRPMALDWARKVRDDCEDYGVAFFLKQLGGWPDTRAHEHALLDGRTHTAFPAARVAALPR